MAYVTPKTWVSGDVVQASQLNQDLRDNVEYVKALTDGFNFSSVQLTRNAATSINDATLTTITWTAEGYDFGGWWSSGSNITTPASAIPSGFTTIGVLVIARTVFASNGTGIRRLNILKNGSNFGQVSTSALTGDTTDLACIDVTTVASGDTVSVQVYQNSGGALNVSSTQVTLIRIAPAS